MRVSKFFVGLVLLSLLGITAVSAKKLTLPLYEIYPVEAVELRCIESQYDVQLPIPERWSINSASLKFSYVNSASLIKRNSQLVVRLNGSPLAQIKLDPNAPEGQAEVDLPKLLLQPGYNKLSFGVSQHYAEQCELPCVPELWTRVKLDQAQITFDYDNKPVPLSIASVANFLFDAKNINQPKVHLINQNETTKGMSLGGVVASGIAIRYDYRPVRFSTSQSIRQDVDNVLIGTREYVNRILAPYNIAIDVDKPHVQIFPLPHISEIAEQKVIGSDPRRALLVITGQDEKQLQIAVESFDILSIPFPDSSTMQVHEFSLPEIGMYTGKQMVKAGIQYPFKKLNFDTYTFRGFSSGLETINFRVPPDFLIKPNQYVNVSLNFAYGAGFRVDSVLNVVLNGHYVSSIHLDNPRGALVSNYQLSLPTYLFKGGSNTLSFSPILTPLVTENCSFIHAENLFLTLFDSSSIEFPKMPHKIEMPRLDLMFVNGFPFTRWPDGYQAHLYLAEQDSHHISAAYNMISVLSQRNGYPLLGLTMGTEIPDKFDGELLMIGTLDALPKKYLDLAPLKFGELNRVPYPVYQGFEQKSALAFNTQNSEMGLFKGALMQFESPDHAGRSVVMMAATSPESVERLSIALQRSDVQTAIEHDLTLIDFIQLQPEPDAIDQSQWRYMTTALRAGKQYITGKGGEISPIEASLARNPYLYWGLLLLSAVLLVWAFRFMIKRQKSHRSQSGEDEV